MGIFTGKDAGLGTVGKHYLGLCRNLGSSHHDVLCVEVKATFECVTGTWTFIHLTIIKCIVS